VIWYSRHLSEPTETAVAPPTSRAVLGQKTLLSIHLAAWVNAGMSPLPGGR